MSEQNDMTLTCQYDEMIPAGRDFRSREVVEAYDAYHRRFRNVEHENAAIISSLGLQASQTIADFGSGTGAFALQAAQHCARVHAIDVSQAMLDYTEWKARSAGATNVICHHGGFLTYVHTDPLLDVIVSSMALHHLPDFWKQKALLRLNAMLKPGGKLFLADVVFSENGYEANIAKWIQEMTATAGADMEADLKSHLCTEFSTFSWIMEGLLARAGFRIDKAEHTNGVLAKYFCTKIA
jgi:ubiquinone/menaquinone biosynthesis C-methylase UbiE